MGLKRLIILLSMILVISPVSTAYASLLDNPGDNNAPHCKHSGKTQAPAKDMKSCCDNDQCGPSCRTMHCGKSIMTIGILAPVYGCYQPQPVLATLNKEIY